MQHHTCCRHWLNTTAGGIAVSLHLTVPVLHVIQLDIFYLFAAAPTVLLPALVYLSHSSPTACLASQPYLLRCLLYYTSPLFVQTTKSALVHLVFPLTDSFSLLSPTAAALTLPPLLPCASTSVPAPPPLPLAGAPISLFGELLTLFR